jgi:hypothetical protein
MLETDDKPRPAPEYAVHESKFLILMLIVDRTRAISR